MVLYLSIPNYGTSLGDSQTIKISDYNLSELNVSSRNRATALMTYAFTTNISTSTVSGTILKN